MPGNNLNLILTLYYKLLGFAFVIEFADKHLGHLFYPKISTASFNNVQQ